MNNAYVNHSCTLYMLSLIITIRYLELYIIFRVSSQTSMLQGTYISFTVYLICYFMWSHSGCILPSFSICNFFRVSSLLYSLFHSIYLLHFFFSFYPSYIRVYIIQCLHISISCIYCTIRGPPSSSS